MKTKLFSTLAILALAVSASADDQVRNVQTELKNQGFYYGEVDGQGGPEMTSAIRRYQIRNGLEVTGTLSQETLAALGMIAAKPKQAAPAPVAKAPEAPRPPVTAKTSPPVNIRRDDTAEDSDRAFLQREERNRNRTAEAYNGDGEPVPPQAPSRNVVPAYRDPSFVPPPAPLDTPSADFPVLFAGTPYANAPATVQQDTLRRAQGILANRGYYRDIVDGLPGPATEEALLGFQRSARLTLTGRLDLATLNELRLLPGGDRRAADPGTRFGFEFHTGHRVFRGVWVDR
jgi:peptidoglycan hydrolase-like protein with peptidoglycan-binding domain